MEINSDGNGDEHLPSFDVAISSLEDETTGPNKVSEVSLLGKDNSTCENNPQLEEGKSDPKGSQISGAKKKRVRYYTCAVALCPNPQGITYFCVPKNDPQISAKWVQAAKRKDEFNVANARFCERHFSPKMFKRDLLREAKGLPPGRPQLIKGAFPDVNLPGTTQNFVQIPDSPEIPELQTRSSENVPVLVKGSNTNYSSYCSVLGCKSPKGIQYHGFPVKNLDLCKTWILQCGRDQTFKPERKKVCATHFTNDSYEPDLEHLYLGKPKRKPVLKEGAIPTLLLGAQKASDLEVSLDVDNEVVDSPILPTTDLDENDDTPEFDQIELAENFDFEVNDEAPTSARGKRQGARIKRQLASDLVLNDVKRSKMVLEDQVKLYQESNEELRDQHEKDQRELEDLRAKLKAARAENKNIKAKNARLQKNVDKLQDKNEQHNKVIDNLSKRMTPGTFKTYMNPDLKWVKYSVKDKVQALVLSAINRKCYRQVREFNQITLPSETTLRRWLSDFDCSPGFQEDSIRICRVMKEKTDIPFYDIAALTFDEMDLKKNVTEIDMKTQRVYGPNKKSQTVVMRGLVSH